jgi:hypothetical protein
LATIVVPQYIIFLEQNPVQFGAIKLNNAILKFKYENEKRKKTDMIQDNINITLFSFVVG